MKTFKGTVTLLVLLLAVVVTPTASRAADDVPACTGLGADLNTAHQFCHYSPEQFRVLVTGHETAVSYSLQAMCVEAQITEPIEEAVNAVAGIRTLTSSSPFKRTGTGTL